MKLRKIMRNMYTAMRYAYLTRTQSVETRPALKTITLAPLIFSSVPRASKNVVIFAACDRNYFKKYARSFVGSFSEHTNHTPIHVHIYNPDISSKLTAENLEHDNPKFSWSYDETDLSSIPPKELGIYFYSVRFVRLHEFIHAAQKPCLCLDVDALCNQNADTMLDRLTQNDIAFHARFNKRGHDTKLLAGTLFVNVTKAGVSLLDEVSSKLVYLIENGSFIDKLDQIVIYDCYRNLKKRCKKFNFMDLKEPFIDTKFNDDGIIWYPKGPTKNHHKYSAYLDKSGRA